MLKIILIVIGLLISGGVGVVMLPMLCDAPGSCGQPSVEETYDKIMHPGSNHVHP